MNYEQITMNNANKNKANSNPIKPNFRKTKMNLNFYPTKDYKNEPLRRRRENKPNQTQSSKDQLRLNFLCYAIRITNHELNTIH